MLKDLPCAAKVRDFLETLDRETLIGMAYTASNKRMESSTKGEAIEVILNHTPDLCRFFAYKRLKKEKLFGYLSKLIKAGVINVSIDAESKATHLIEYTRRYWETVPDDTLQSSPPPNVSQTQICPAPSPPSDFEPRSLALEPRIPPPLPSSSQLPFFPSGPHSSVHPNSSHDIWFPFVSKEPDRFHEPVGHNVSHNPAGPIFPQSPMGQSVSRWPMDQDVSQSLVPTNNFRVPAETSNNQTAQTVYQINLNVTVTSHLNLSLDITTNSNGARSEDFTKTFCEWFYNLMNKLHPKSQQSGHILGEDMFLSESRAFIYIFSHQIEERRGEGKRGTCQIIKDTLTAMRLFFSPDVSFGNKISRGGNDTYRVFCSGKLHNGNVSVGTFEQEFDLSERDHLWKIVYTRLNLKQAGLSIQSQ